MKLLIKGGRIVDPLQNLEGEYDVLVDDGKVAALERNIKPGAGVEVIDVPGCIVAPGFIDMHVHLREPGLEHKETIATGTRAAAAGGFVAVAAMPNTEPVADNASVITYIKEKAAREGAVRVYPIGAITKGSKGEELSEIADLAEAGAVALSDDGRPVMNAEIMRRALEYAGMFNLPVIAHCEDLNLSAGGVMNEGFISTILGLRGIPAGAEEVMVARDLILAAMTKGKLHLAHISTAGSVQLLQQAKERGIKVTAEVTPHHLCLTEEEVVGYNTNAKVNPPLRTRRDCDALGSALAGELIEVIASDHAPHAAEEKDVEFDFAPFGMVGLETAVPLVVTFLIRPGLLTWKQAVAAWSSNPARILNVPGGSLAPGSTADITIINPAEEREVDVRRFYSLGKNSPLQGRKLYGWPAATIVGGRIIMREGEVLV
ncbi:MAG: dihydroorotase [Clostridia bacterium]|nr:dihydroorotase [Clostridia bacterium]